MLGNIVFVEVTLYLFPLLDQISMNASQASRQDGSYSVSGKLEIWLENLRIISAPGFKKYLTSI